MSRKISSGLLLLLLFLVVEVVSIIIIIIIIDDVTDNMSRKEEWRRFASIEDSVDSWMQRLENYIQ